jgi:hypothetical protein
MKCGEEVDDDLMVCWNCQADKRGSFPNGTPPAQGNDSDRELKRFLNTKHRAKECAECHSPLNFLGTKQFHEGVNWGFLGDLGEVFVGHTNLDMYVCPSCLRVEFFVADAVV